MIEWTNEQTNKRKQLLRITENQYFIEYFELSAKSRNFILTTNICGQYFINVIHNINLELFRRVLKSLTYCVPSTVLYVINITWKSVQCLMDSQYTFNICFMRHNSCQYSRQYLINCILYNRSHFIKLLGKS